MIPTKTDYPVFEANQVLTNEHLNSVRDYLDEQNRLTRVTLHGIGVVCGLEVSLSANTITISKGYGVTSEGYLAIIGTTDFVADRQQGYTVPKEDGYELFADGNFTFWELLDTGHDDYANGTPLTSPFLADKVVLLFVELREDNLKNCSPGSCDDKGKKVDITIRKLLIAESDLLKLNQKIADNLEAVEAQGDFFPDLTARLDLPDLRLPGLDVPASNMADAQTIFAAYRKILSPRIAPTPPAKLLFEKVWQALDNAYAAFSPILTPLPNATFFSDTLKAIKSQYDRTLNNRSTAVIFSQYIYDFLDDLIQAYEEFRWKALDFMALCCPPVEVFPRHLELGETGAGNFAGKKEHRHYFRPSPALSEQKKLGEEVRQLFQRLALMVESFKAPGVPDGRLARIPVKITPSKFGDVPLSEKAVPYYYDSNNALALAASWNYQKTRTGRPKAILGYHIETEYHQDTDANLLNYDLEKYNFFRIEGHMGIDWREILKDLLGKIKQYRLSFDVVALNAHPATVAADVLQDPLISQCLTNDLQVIFDAWAKELECLMKDKIKFITQFVLPGKQESRPPASETFSAISSRAGRQPSRINILPSIDTGEGTLGSVISEVVRKTPDPPSIDDLRAGVTTRIREIPEINDLTISDYDVAIGYRLDLTMAMIEFSDAIPANASDLKYSIIEEKYNKLTTALTRYRDKLIAYQPPAARPAITAAQKDQLLKEIQALLSNCLIKRLEGLGTELERRNKQVEELLYFSKYVVKHPDIRHKSGVPSGGTFVIVFQELPTPIADPGNGSFASGLLTDAVAINSTLSNTQRSAALESNIPVRTERSAALELNTAVRTERSAALELNLPIGVGRIVPPEFNIPERVVIADFFLPYRCCSDCPPVQFVLPAARPIFTLNPQCSDDEGNAKVHLEFTYRTPPCEVKIDDQEYVDLVDDLITLSIGKHTVIVRDSEGGISLPQEIEIFPHFVLEPERPICSNDNTTYTVRIKVTNGQLPMFIAGREAETVTEDGNIHFITAGPFPSGQPTDVEIGDSSVCPPQVLTFEHTCVPLVTNPDTVETDFNTAVTIRVLDNDSGSGLTVTDARVVSLDSLGGAAINEARLPESDERPAPPPLGSVVINGGQTITYTPAPTMENQDVAIIYTVTDTDGRTNEGTATVHINARPCDLPCEGQSRRCAYRLWIQPPAEGARYEIYRQDRRNIVFRYNGTEIVLPGTTDLLSAETTGLNKKFQDTIGGIVKNLNNVINQALNDKFGALSRPRLLITYEPDVNDPFGILWIEYFVCETFSIELNYAFARPAPAFSMSMRYTNEPLDRGIAFNGAISTNKRSNQVVQVPAFDCRERNQCTGTDYEKLCTGAKPTPAFSVQRLADGRFLLTGKVVNNVRNDIAGNPARNDIPVNLSRDEIVAWVWDIFSAQPTEPFYEGIKAEVSLQTPTGVARLSVITRNGCFGFTDQGIVV